jgi:HSP20 family protein
MSESATEYAIKVQVPGMPRESLKIEVGDGYLYISGESKEEKEDKGKRWHRKEIQYGSFSRTVRLPGPVVMDKVAAKLDKGVLAITIPKSETSKVQPRTITIV